MILVRDIFQLKYGKAREAVAIWKGMMPSLIKAGHSPSRLLTDLTGQYYTLVLESTFASLSEFEKGHEGTSMDAEFRAAYEKFVPLVDSGRREIFTIVA